MADENLQGQTGEGHNIWIDVCGLQDTMLIGQLGQAYGVHTLALEDVLDTHQRAKMEEYDDDVFFIMHRLRFDAEGKELYSEQISLYAGDGFLLSFQEDPDDTFQDVRKRIEENLGRIRRRKVDYLLYTLIDMIADGYFNALEDIDRHIVTLEENVHLADRSGHPRQHIYELKGLLGHFRSKVMPMRDAITRLYRSESPIIAESTRPYIRDISDHVQQVLDIMDSQREMLTNIENLYLAEAGNRMNEVMRFLTVINTIFIPLTFIAGVYGMNFENMPELGMHYAYFVVMGFMAALVAGMLLYFRRKGWM
jgi:magnesium transporter